MIKYDGKKEVMTSRYGSAFSPTLSSDGKWLVYGSRFNDKTGLIKLFNIPFEVDEKIVLGPQLKFDYLVDDSPTFSVNQIRDTQISPDGSMAVFTALNKLYIMNFEDEKSRNAFLASKSYYLIIDKKSKQGCIPIQFGVTIIVL